MLALLHRGTARLLADVRMEPMSRDHDDTYSIDMNAICAILPSSPNFPWNAVASLCGQTISPVYQRLQSMLSADMEHVTKMFAELTPIDEEDIEEDDLDLVAPIAYPQYQSNLGGNRRRCTSLSPDLRPSQLQRRRRCSSASLPMYFPSLHPSAPAILITPCSGSSSGACSSRVPIQDASHGSKLVVPGFVHHNLPSSTSNQIQKPGHTPFIEQWQWKEERWWAVVPDLETQEKRGWYSRPLVVRRKASRLSVASKLDAL